MTRHIVRIPLVTVETGVDGPGLVLEIYSEPLEAKHDEDGKASPVSKLMEIGLHRSGTAAMSNVEKTLTPQEKCRFQMNKQEVSYANYHPQGKNIVGHSAELPIALALVMGGSKCKSREAIATGAFKDSSSSEFDAKIGKVNDLPEKFSAVLKQAANDKNWPPQYFFIPKENADAEPSLLESKVVKDLAVLHITVVAVDSLREAINYLEVQIIPPSVKQWAAKNPWLATAVLLLVAAVFSGWLLSPTLPPPTLKMIPVAGFPQPGLINLVYKAEPKLACGSRFINYHTLRKLTDGVWQAPLPATIVVNYLVTLPKQADKADYFLTVARVGTKSGTTFPLQGPTYKDVQITLDMIKAQDNRKPVGEPWAMDVPLEFTLYGEPEESVFVVMLQRGKFNTGKLAGLISNVKNDLNKSRSLLETEVDASAAFFIEARNDIPSPCK